MKILSNTGGVFATNAYLVVDEASKEAVLFDAPNDTVAPLLEEATRQGWTIKGLWLTHGHIDHVADHALVTSQFPAAKVLIHPLDEPKLVQPMNTAMLGFQSAGRRADEYLSDGQELAIGSIKVRVVHTPGHSPGHVVFHFLEEHVLIGGDLIIMGAVGRTDFPDSSPEGLDASIRRLSKLDPSTRLLPGHGSSSTLAEEFSANPYVRRALAGG